MKSNTMTVVSKDAGALEMCETALETQLQPKVVKQHLKNDQPGE
jgi:hypothetical protein